jgi:hypothetical protein
LSEWRPAENAKRIISKPADDEIQFRNFSWSCKKMILAVFKESSSLPLHLLFGSLEQIVGNEKENRMSTD